MFTRINQLALPMPTRRGLLSGTVSEAWGATKDSPSNGAARPAPELGISVIIPAYNCARYLKRAIDSVLVQTHAVGEIIVIDDGSTDETPAVLARYGDRIRVLRVPNGGVSRARNQGLRLARHRWVAFLDADDWWMPAKIEKQVEIVEKNPQVDFIYTGIRMVQLDGRADDRVTTDPDRVWPGLRHTNPITPSTVMARRDLLLAAGGFDESLRMCEDWELWARLGENVRYGAVEQPMVYYQITPGSLSSQVEAEVKTTESIAQRTLLTGLSGFRRRVEWRRLTSAQLFRASVASREIDAKQALRYLFRSLWRWPSPAFMPERWKSLLLAGRRAVLGR